MSLLQRLGQTPFIPATNCQLIVFLMLSMGYLVLENTRKRPHFSHFLSNDAPWQPPPSPMPPAVPSVLHPWIPYRRRHLRNPSSAPCNQKRSISEMIFQSLGKRRSSHLRFYLYNTSTI